MCCIFKPKHNQSISRVLWISFLADFCYLAQLCATSYHTTAFRHDLKDEKARASALDRKLKKAYCCREITDNDAAKSG